MTDTPVNVKYPDLDHIVIMQLERGWRIDYHQSITTEKSYSKPYASIKNTNIRYVSSIMDLLVNKCHISLTMISGCVLAIYWVSEIVDHREYIMNRLYEMADDPEAEEI